MAWTGGYGYPATFRDESGKMRSSEDAKWFWHPTRGWDHEPNYWLQVGKYCWEGGSNSPDDGHGSCIIFWRRIGLLSKERKRPVSVVVPNSCSGGIGVLMWRRSSSSSFLWRGFIGEGLYKLCEKTAVMLFLYQHLLNVVRKNCPCTSTFMSSRQKTALVLLP